MAKVKLGDVAIEKRETWTGSTQGVPIVGLEHLIPGEVTLSSWDSDTDNTFSKMFRKDQVLLGRRRVYLRKAVIAPFEGICSGDITVIEAIPGKISSRLLPFVIQNERFFDYALQGSAGSLSPRVKWEHLKDYEFNLPDYEDQDSLADKLWSALKLKESYQRLLSATDEMVKSRFIEMFRRSQTVTIGSMFETTSGGTPSSKQKEYYDSGTIPWLTSGEVAKGKISDTAGHITELGLLHSSAKWVPVNTVVIAMYGATVGKVGLLTIPCTTNQAICSVLPKESVNPLYLYHAIKSKEMWMSEQAVGAAQPNISQAVIRKMEIPMPCKDLQDAFVRFAEQADKSKYLS